MGTSKGKPAATPNAVASQIRFLLRPQNRGLVLSAVIALAAIGASVYAWRKWGEPAMQSADYVVTPERITATAPPAWIHADVRAEVIRSAGIKQLDLRDPKLLEKLSHAFSLHPWVARVTRIEKRFPARIDVDLRYRQPVAVVEVVPQGKSELLFVDEESVLLPSADFSPNQAKDYLRIAAGNETTASIFGMAWGSKRIAGGARLAALWGSRWQALALYRIVAVESAAGQITYELRTRGDVRVVWGAAPGGESAGEASAEQKITALEQFVQDKGPLEREGGLAVIDLRELAAVSTKTASRKTRAER